MPNFGGSRLGFWSISKKLTIDPNSRSARKSNNTILFVGDVNGNENWYRPGTRPGFVTNNGLYGWQTDFKNYGTPTPDPNNLTESSYQDLSSSAIALGYTTEYCPSYAEFVSGKYDNKITHYPMIWDLAFASYFGRFNSVRPSDTIGPKVAALYRTSLQNGGGLCLLGEVVYLNGRNATICDFITDVGGGNVFRNNRIEQIAPDEMYFNPFGLDEVDIATEFLISNKNATAKLGQSGRFKTINSPPYGLGTGTKMVYVTMRQYLPVQYGVYGAMWKTGSLTGYQTGAIIALFDKTFAQKVYALQSDLVDNMIISLDRK